MALKLNEVKPGYVNMQIAANFKLIQDYVNEMTLKREPGYREANQMLQHLVITPTLIGIDVGHVSTEGVVGEEGDLCFITPPPVDYGTGLLVSQSVLEILHVPSADLRMTQSVLEVLSTPVSTIQVTQSVLEVLHEI